MKVIEALKKTKDLLRKADDIKSKISLYCADLEAEKPTYGTVEDQTKQISEWLQSYGDLIKEVERLRLAIQTTNLKTQVSVEISDGKRVTKSVAGWIHRRKDLAEIECRAWSALTNRNLRPQNYKKDPSDEGFLVANVRRYYDQKERDRKVEEYTSEPSRIDAALEVSNAVTDLIES